MNKIMKWFSKLHFHTWTTWEGWANDYQYEQSRKCKVCGKEQHEKGKY